MVFCSFNSNKNKILPLLHIISNDVDDLSKKYDNIILLGDFNIEPKETNMSNFLNTYNLKNIIKKIHVSKTQIDRPVSI